MANSSEHTDASLKFAETLPPFRQGEDTSLKHVAHPTLREQASVSGAQLREKIQGMTSSALHSIQGLVSKNTQETIASQAAQAKEIAEKSIHSIWEFVGSTRLSDSAQQVEKWMIEEAKAAQDKIWGTANKHYPSLTMSEHMREAIRKKESDMEELEREGKPAIPHSTTYQ